ncbi:hypothetical protein VKT23_010490 [Stygiomarasmius scandens]|uniref:Uncharacterized protein n=1 Tax=Marasmiellus scandens TaxID=2682957 RepID=A0ABR1JF64_9AGAR
MRLQLILTSFGATLLLFLCILVRIPQTNAVDFDFLEWPPKISFDEELSEFREKISDFGDKISTYTDALLEEVNTSIGPSVKSLIDDLQSKINSIVSSPGLEALHSELESHLLAMHNSTCKDGTNDIDADGPSSSCSSDKEVNLLALDGFFEFLTSELESTVDAFRVEFSADPSTALNHEQRKEAVEALMDRVEEVIVEVMNDRVAVPREVTREHIAGVKAVIVSVIVLIGDLVEQHPWLFEFILFSLFIEILAEIRILRIILQCFGLGPVGPAKGSPAAWAQRIFFGGRITKGSWLSALQRVAMKGGK